MFKTFITKAELERLQPVIDYLHSIDPRQPVVEQKKKNYTWFIVAAVIIGLAAIGLVVYKMFFEVCDDFDDFDDEDFEDIDFDDDYDEEFEEFEEVVEEEIEEEPEDE